MRTQKKHQLAQLRHYRVRHKVSGTAARPRMSVCFTGQHIYVQFIDDSAGVTLASTSTRAKELTNKNELAANVKGAKFVGTAAAEAAKAKSIVNVVFDRSGCGPLARLAGRRRARS